MGGEQRGKAVAQRLLAFAGEAPAGDIQPETIRRQPDQAIECGGPASAATLLFVNRRIMVIDRDANGQPVAVAVPKVKHPVAQLAKRLHRVGQHQGVQPARQHGFQHRDDIGVHERLPAGEADQLRREAVAGDLVEVSLDIGKGQVGQPVVARR